MDLGGIWGYKLEKKEILDMSWIHSLPPFPSRPKQYLEPEQAVGHILKNV
jgi:hypothetical protein